MFDFAEIWYRGASWASRLKPKMTGETDFVKWQCSANCHLFSFGRRGPLDKKKVDFISVWNGYIIISCILRQSRDGATHLC